MIYDPLPPGVIDELESKNPYDPTKKRRKHLHHRLLTTDVGHPHLEKQIVSVTTLLSVSDNWEEFATLFCKKFKPKSGDLFALPPPKITKAQTRKYLSPLVGAVRRCQGTICSVSPWVRLPPPPPSF